MRKLALAAFLAFAGAAIVFAGVTSGSPTVDITVVTHAKPTAALAGSGAGLVDDGDHYVKCAYVTATGTTIPGTASDVVTVADKSSNGKINVTVVASADPTVTGINVYATEAGGSAYYLVTTTALANSNATYVYNIADATLITQGAAPATDTASAAADTTVTCASGYSLTYLWVRNDADTGNLLVSLDGSTPTTTNGFTLEPNTAMQIELPAVPGDNIFYTGWKMRFATGGGEVSYIYHADKRG